MKENDVVEVLSYARAETRNGDAISLKVILPEHKETREETAMIIPLRFEEECEKKVPCLLFYHGQKKLDGGKKCHQVSFLKPDDPTVFRESDDEDDSDDDDDARSDGEAEHRLSINDFIPKCLTCGKSGESCFGFCKLCNAHQPLNGSQCRCVI
jgi:hypothetical protein